LLAPTSVGPVSDQTSGLATVRSVAGLCGGSGFVERAGDLLFAAFKPDDAYLIGVYGHLTDWARRDILEVVVHNWPDAGIMLATFAVGLTQQFADAERQELRHAGISSSMIEIEGKV
jgi:hypothetical protein